MKFDISSFPFLTVSRSSYNSFNHYNQAHNLNAFLSYLMSFLLPRNFPNFTKTEIMNNVRKPKNILFSLIIRCIEQPTFSYESSHRDLLKKYLFEAKIVSSMR